MENKTTKATPELKEMGTVRKKKKQRSNTDRTIRKVEAIFGLLGIIADAAHKKLIEILSIAFAGLAMMLIIAKPLGIEINALSGEHDFTISCVIGITLLILMYEKINDIRKK